MKRTIMILCFSLLVFSCDSGKLTNSKAEDIISDCLESEPEDRSVSIKINKVQFSKNQKEEVLKYEELRDDGYLELTLIEKPKLKPLSNSNDPLASWRREAEIRRQERYYKEYDISLTKKAEDFIVKARENSNFVTLKTFNYEVDEVLEVQEIPTMNTAKVKVKFKAVDLTPFAILYKKDPSKLWIDDVSMSKTSNGWKYCDDYD
ncbi:hypothetical protein DKG77_07435 [Flagellimonas aquimarina]|uniref:Lipoprotein n=1 Tax=Flagellimonas aquimarina TaxID=2201895 RepID=A0A316KV64_9FLAO|nr:hypothetical protein [Allomuricauda koreensis]PWL38117.1 hypothetical protein DKG77_07435 [Allomuricauda koreensis]